LWGHLRQGMDDSASHHSGFVPAMSFALVPCRFGLLLARSEFSAGRLVRPAALGTYGAAHFVAHVDTASASVRFSSSAALARTATISGSGRHRSIPPLDAVAQDGAPADGSSR